MAAEVWNLSKANDFFTGRDKYLQEIHTILEKDKKLAIVGYGGIGKSQLAKQFAHTFYKKYDIIWWIDTDKALEQQLASLSIELQLLEPDNKNLSALPFSHLILYIKNKLRNTNKSWLLIFDNITRLDEVEDILPDICCQSQRHHLLFTSKNTNEFIPTLELKKFNRSESLTFLTRTIGRHQKKNLEPLAAILGDFPLALAQAAAYIKANNTEISDYLNMYEYDVMSLLSKEQQLILSEGDNLGLQKKNVLSTFQLSLEKAKGESNSILPVLQLLALFDTKQVGKNFIFQVLNEAGINNDDISKSIRILKKYSLIEEASSNVGVNYIIHDNTRILTRKMLLSSIFHSNESSPITYFDDAFQLYKALISTLNKLLSKPLVGLANNNFDNRVLPLAYEVISLGVKNDNLSTLLPQIMIYLLEYNNILFFKEASQKVYQNIVEDLHNLLDIQKLQIPPDLRARYVIGSVFADYIYTNKETTQFFEQQLLAAIKFVEHTKPSVDDMLLTYSNASQFYLFTGNFKTSLSYLEKAYPFIEQGTNPNLIAQFWYSITWLYIEMGNYEKANQTVKKLLEASQVANVRYILYLYALNLQSFIDFRLNTYDASFTLAKKCFDLAMDFFQNENEDVIGNIILTLGRHYLLQGDYEAAEANVKKAISIFESIYGQPYLDPSQAAAHIVLGELYMKRKRYDLAYAEFVSCEKYYNSFYKKKLSDVNEASILLANFVALGIETKDYPLTQKYLGILKETYSLDNPNLVRVIGLLK